MKKKFLARLLCLGLAAALLPAPIARADVTCGWTDISANLPATAQGSTLEDMHFISADGGQSWTNLGSVGATPTDISFAPGSVTGYVGGFDGKIRRVTSTEIQNMISGIGNAIRGISATAADRAWCAVNGSILWYDGTAWIGTDPPDYEYWAISMLDDSEGWAVGLGGIIVHLEWDGWAVQTNPDPSGNNLYDVFFLNQNEGWAVGSGGIILHTADGGDTWSIEGGGLTLYSIKAVQFTSSTNGYAAGNNGNLLKYGPTGGGAVTDAGAQDSAAIPLELWYIGEGTTIVLTDELGAEDDDGLIDKLIAAGHGGKNMYQVLQLLQPYFSGVITGRFMKTLASAPADSNIFLVTAEVATISVNNPTCINADGTVRATSVYGRDYHGDTGYTTTGSSLSGVGPVWVTAADSAGYLIDTGREVEGMSGQNYKTFAILWSPVPPGVATDAVASSGVTRSGAAVSGSVTEAGTAAVTERGFVYGTSANPTTAGSKVTAGTGTGDFSAALTGLAAGTAYRVRAYAISAAGTAYGEDRAFAT